MKGQVERYSTSLIIDRKQYTISFNGKELSLFLKEFELLSLFAKHPGWVYTKQQIFESIYGSKKVNNIDNTIFCLIYSLRKKLEPDLKNPIFIKTVRGVGYKLNGVTVQWKNE